MAYKKKARLGIVVWYDTHSIDPWCGIPTQYDELVVRSVGFIQEYKNGVVIIPNKSDISTVHVSEDCYGISHIPRGCVKSIKYLEQE